MPLIFQVKVIPSSGRQKWILDESGNMKCYLKSAPEKGKANQELIKILSKLLRIGQNEISIVSGSTNRSKKILIHREMTKEELLNLLGLSTQKKLF